MSLNLAKKMNISDLGARFVIVSLVFALFATLAFPQTARAGFDFGFEIVNQSTTEAVTEQALRGGRQEFPSAEDRSPVRKFFVVATAYSSDPWQTDATPCVPAMAKFNLCDYYAKYGVEDTVATNILPLGAHVRFPELYGERIFIVRDRMNAKYNGRARIDFWKSDKASAVVFGVKRVKMEVL